MNRPPAAFSASTPSQRSFYIVAFTSMTLLMTGVLTTPLYGLYATQFALAPIEVTLIYSAYAIAVVPTFFVFGPLGDKVGRKLVLIAAVVFALASTFFFLFAQSSFWLVVGRVLQGVAVGAAMGNATAALVELEPNRDRRRASQVAGTWLFAGLFLGPLVAGFTAQYLPAPTTSVFGLDLAVLAVNLGLLLTIKEPGQWPKPEPFRLKRPSVPSEIKTPFASATLASTLVFAMSALYFSVAPTYIESLLNTSNVLVGGSVTSIMVLVAIVSQRFIQKVKAKTLLVVGQLCLAAGLLLIVLAHFVPSVFVLGLGALVSGVAYGGTFLGSVAIINAVSPETRRGDITSLFYAIGYLALGVPIIALGLVAQASSLFEAVRFFAAIMIAVALAHVAWILLRGKSVSE